MTTLATTHRAALPDIDVVVRCEPVCTIEARRIDETVIFEERTAGAPNIHKEAFKAWMNCGSPGLGLWLARYKERTTGRRNFTVAEYASWVRIVKVMEGDE